MSSSSSSSSSSSDSGSSDVQQSTSRSTSSEIATPTAPQQQTQQQTQQPPTRQPAKAADTPSAAPFINEGYERWKRQRQSWTKGAVSPSKLQSLRLTMGELDELADELRHMPTHGVLSKPVPLAELIDVLMEIWEDSGLV